MCTLRTEKTSGEVVEIVPCVKNKWGNWWDFWFYVVMKDIEGVPRLPPSILCSHGYVAFPRFEVRKGLRMKTILRRAPKTSSERDLME